VKLKDQIREETNPLISTYLVVCDLVVPEGTSTAFDAGGSWVLSTAFADMTRTAELKGRFVVGSNPKSLKFTYK
jgi:hypothetical protein